VGFSLVEELEGDEEGKVNLRWVITGRAVTYGGVLKREGGGRRGLPLPTINA
jgi:hypothetical protein